MGGAHATTAARRAPHGRGVCRRARPPERGDRTCRLAHDGCPAGQQPRAWPPRGHAAFTLLLQERTGVGITFTEVAQVVSGVHLAPTAAAQAGAWRLAPRGELRLPVWVWWVCPEAGEACVAGPPHWHLRLM